MLNACYHWTSTFSAFAVLRSCAPMFAPGLDAAPRIDVRWSLIHHNIFGNDQPVDSVFLGCKNTSISTEHCAERSFGVAQLAQHLPNVIGQLQSLAWTGTCLICLIWTKGGLCIVTAIQVGILVLVNHHGASWSRWPLLTCFQMVHFFFFLWTQILLRYVQV